ncbi:MAG: hypothetical protein LBH01_01755 [Verrucomicrobiales bacterium]|jgi:hypothetical protein|nr:hypothetical protein [Verrucomicrobiales bacterium]
MKKDPHPMPLKLAELIGIVIILLVIGGPGVYLLISSARHNWQVHQLLGSFLLISTAVTMCAMLWQQK